MSLRAELGRAYQYEYEARQRSTVKLSERMDRAAGQVVGLKKLYEVQGLIRPLYGKEGIQEPLIGDHPDFIHLRGTTGTEYCAITTLFMDIEGSTRLGLLYPLEEVVAIKNAFICAAMEIVSCFDGHVHRVMGDAVMAYFGGRGVTPEAGIIDAINCAAVLRYFTERSVLPFLKDRGFDDPFGIRIGVDHGPRDKVLWASYGYPGMQEVTATSFHVDVSSKLQHAAGRNEIMLGESILKTIDFPDELLAIKTFTRDGREFRDPWVTPNYTDRQGKPINYKQRLLQWKDYLRYSPLGSGDQELFAPSGVQPLRLSAHWASTRDGEVPRPYHASSRALPKRHELRFTVPIEALPAAVQTLRFIVENHGEEAVRLGGSGRGSHDTTLPVNRTSGVVEHWESVLYRGLHYMTVEASTAGGVSHRGRFGVYVE